MSYIQKLENIQDLPFFIGEKLTELRKGHQKPKPSQETLGALFGVSARQYQRYEKNETELSIEQVLVLSKFFNYDLLSYATGGKCVIVDEDGFVVKEKNVDYKIKYETLKGVLRELITGEISSDAALRKLAESPGAAHGKLRSGVDSTPGINISYNEENTKKKDTSKKADRSGKG